MPQIEVHFTDGRKKEFPLSRKAPLTIGAQAFNDISIADAGLSPLHCRIGWNKSGYEVTAATPKGVDLNGTIVEHAFLKPGDVLRVGSCDLYYRGDGETSSKKGEAAKPAESAPKPAPEKEPPPPPPESSIFEGQVLVDDEAIESAEESIDELPVLKRAEKEKPAPLATGLAGQVGRELQGGRKRPGEQEIFKSPLVLGLGGGSVVLLLIAGTIWFLMGRETSAQLFAQAEQELSEAKYSQAIEHFELYVTRYPASGRTKSAKLQAAKARVQKELAGATPAWSLAWERLQGLVREYRNSPDYNDLKPAVRSYAEQIAYGAAVAAEQTRDATLLPTSADALQLLERSADPDVPLGPIVAKVQEATLKAEAAIARQRTRDESVARMQQFLTDKKPIEALVERESLLRKFPQYRTDRGVIDVLEQALSTAKTSVSAEDVKQPAQPVAESPIPLHVWPVLHSRSRTDEASLGESVWLLAGDCCYAIDTVTGEPRWRRVIGPDSPIDPVEIRSDPAAWLMYDSRQRQLLSCRVDTGKLNWRQTLDAPPVGSPLVDQEQIYLVIANGQLLRIDQETGELSARVQFSQPIQGPPTLDVGGNTLYLAGERGLIYTLQKRPLECVAVTFTDHAAGAIRAPIVAMGQLLLVCENDRANSSRLRLWTSADVTQPLTQVSEVRVPGLVFDAPALRGPQLIVPLNGERIAAFVANDEPGRMGIKSVGEYRVQDGYDGPMYVMLGPDQTFWMSSTALRQFHIASDTLQMSPTSTAIGLSTQKPQSIREMFYLGRQIRYTSAIQMTNVDREKMTGNWRTVVGAKPAAVLSGSSGNLIEITDSGTVYSIPSSRLKSGGMERVSGTDLEWPPQLTEQPLITTLADGRVAIAIASQPSRLWIVEKSGRVNAPIDLTLPLECGPIQLAQGLVLPQKGLLSLRPNNPSQKFAEWPAPVVADGPTRWVQLIRSADDEFLAVDADGHCRRMQVRMGDIPHLAEVAAVDLTPLVPVAPLQMADSAIFANIDQELIQLDQRTLAPLSRKVMPHPVRGMTLMNQSVLLVWDQETLRLTDPAQDFADRWSLLLKGANPLAQVVLRNDELWVATVEGLVLILNPHTGEVLRQQQLPQELTLGLLAVEDAIWAIAADGTLYHVEPGTEQRP